MSSRRTVFLVNLLQDVNILRPLAYLAARQTQAQIAFLVSARFYERDRRKMWAAELHQIAQDVGASVTMYDEVFAAYQTLMGGRGIIVAASESDLPAHRDTHDVFRIAPSSYLKVTLQHGYECVGFLHSRAHDMAHGSNIGSAADVLAGWCLAANQRSLSRAQSSKYYLSGPAALITAAPRQQLPPSGAEALICENLHSVRFTESGDHRDAFMETFRGFCAALDTAGKTVALRPHPSGKREFKIGADISNTVLTDQPIYKLPLAEFLYGVSPPSSVLIDMILAGLPAAVWHDADGVMDAGNYRGLATVSLPGDLLAFRRAVLSDAEAIVRRQAAFLDKAGMLTSPRDIEARFTELLSPAAGQARVRTSASTAAPSLSAGRNLLVISDTVSATQAISFVHPLSAPQFANWNLTLQGHDPAWLCGDGVETLWKAHAPDILVLSRYTEPGAAVIIDHARKAGVPVIFHIDDDLLNVPPTLGPGKFERYNNPDRLAALRHGMDASDLVYASTSILAETLSANGVSAPIVSGDIYCAVDPENCRAPVRSPGPVIGYMATGGHGADLDLALPAIIDLMRDIPDLRFETFGTIKPPPELAEFGPRVAHHPGLSDYEQFLDALAQKGWWIGIAPLLDTPFNRCKADTKWVEYSFAGIPVVASDVAPYRQACSEGAGRLASGKAEWRSALEELLLDRARGDAMLDAARKKLAATYSRDRLADQVLGIIAAAEELAARPMEPQGDPSQ